ncbi:DEAD/DEAH box helicase [Saccharicrinis aurantiacus]|uniref:DEAD/DEAH box helicase n=1 Tax=Saccharicrinis aurantiacus TaxID=1849719 RepID=UPI00083830AA|nr:DEAD/DEAH box helicase [Saccharicrinis aurantiacus]
MKLKKLIPELASELINHEYDKEPREVQTVCIPKIKSGADMFVIAPEGSGKTTAIIISIIQQLKKPFEEAPRAIIMVESKAKAFAVEEQFDLLSKQTKLRSFIVFDEGIMQYQKDMIYEGVDVVIGTPKRIGELLSVQGIPMTKVKIFAVDDAEMLSPHLHHPVIYRIADGIEKSQFLFFANKWTDKFEKVEERMMKNPLIMEFDEHSPE